MLDFIRGIVRPTLTWGGFTVLSAVVGYQALWLKQPVPDWYQIMVGMMIAFWFQSRKVS